LLINFANQLETVDYSLAVRQGKIEVQLALHAQENSDLATLFNAPVNDKSGTSIGKFLPADGNLQWISRYDPNTIKLLMRHIIDALFVYGKDQMFDNISDQDVYNFFDTMWHICNGVTATQVNMVDGGNVEIRQLRSASITPEQMALWVNFSYGKIAPVVLNGLMKMGYKGEFSARTEVAPKAFVHQKCMVSRANVYLTFGKESQKVKYEFPYYYCAFGDMAAMTNSEKAMRDLIDNYKRKKLPQPSVADSLPLEKNVALRLQSNLADWIFPPVNLTVHLGDDCARLSLVADGEILGKWLKRIVP
jgi:hypothetical protein